MAKMEEDKNYIQVIVNGQIESAQFAGLDRLMCKYSWKYGDDWSVKMGVDSAYSQQAEKRSADPTIVWNFPIDATFQTTEPHGWPQLSLALIGPDWYGRDIIRGYGAVHVPTQAGRHVVYVKMFAPQSSSLFQGFLSFIGGTPPEFSDPRFPATGEVRASTHILATQAACR